jgi:predicted nucleic acid-binding protein
MVISMNLILDSSVFLRFLDPSNPILKNYVTDLLLILEDDAFIVNVPPIVYAEVITQAFFLFQNLIAKELMNLISMFNFIFDADQSILNTCSTIAENYPALGGSDILIIAWAIKTSSILVTIDERQSKKSNFMHLTNYNIDDGFQRKALLSKLLD